MSSKQSGKNSGEQSTLTFSFEAIQKDPHFPMYVALAIGAVTLFIILFTLWARRAKKGQSILICGPSDAGKTILFGQLAYKQPVKTYTSMQENVGIVCPPGKATVNLMDLPGHDRLRYNYLAKHKKHAKGIIYVLDASTITKGIRDATEFLFKVLSDPTLHSNRVPILIACNKQDLAQSKGSSVIERELAKEIGLLRETHSRSLQGTDGSASSNHTFLGKRGKDFAFSDIPAKVDFCEISALQDENIDKVNAWVANNA